MLPPKCFTCGTEMSNKQIIYEERIEEICKDIGETETEEQKKEKRELLDEIELFRPCCRMRIMGYEKLIDKIK